MLALIRQSAQFLAHPAFKPTLLAALVFWPALASGQEALPSYATARESIEGTIAAFDGKYALTLDDVRGFSDSVTLRAGTTVDPAGVSLTVGWFVRITGHADGKTFAADDVDADVTGPDASAYTDATGDGDASGAAQPALLPAFAYVPLYVPPPGYGRFPGPVWLPPPHVGPPRTGSPAPHPPPVRRPPVAPPHRPVDPPRPR